MDFKKIMNEKKESISYNKIYEQSINNITAKFIADTDLTNKLENKRKFGLEKYKEYSFQSSFENTISAPIYEHAEEEIIDLINYLLHIYYVNLIKCDEKSNIKIGGLILKTAIIYNELRSLKKE